MTLLLDKNFIPTKEASKLFGYHSDYIARLCRESKVVGVQVGRSWYVKRDSLQNFVREQKLRKIEISYGLSTARAREYQGDLERPEVKAELRTLDFRGKSSLTRGLHLRFFSWATAPAFAGGLTFLVIIGAAYVAQGPFPTFFAKSLERSIVAYEESTPANIMESAPRALYILGDSIGSSVSYAVTHAPRTYERTVFALVSTPKEQQAAVLIPARTNGFGETIAFGTYESVRVFFTGLLDRMAIAFGIRPRTTLVVVPTDFNTIPSTGLPEPRSTAITNSYSTLTTNNYYVSHGASEEYVHAYVGNIYDYLMTRINAASLSGGSRYPNTSTITSLDNQSFSGATITNSSFSGSVTATTLTVSGDATFNSTGTTTFSGPVVFGTITGSTQCLHVNSSGVISGTGTDCGSGGSGVTGLRAQYSSLQTGSPQIFATSTDTNVTLTITSSGDTHTFTPGWTGVLSVIRGGTGLSSLSANGLLIADSAGTGFTQVATSSLGLSTTNITEGTNLYYTTTRFATALAGTTTDALAEGVVNKYYTDARARAAISVGATGLTYNSSTGVVTYTGLATTSQPSSSQLLVSNGGAGVYGVATSSATLGLGLSGSITGLGASNSLTIATSSLYSGSANQIPYFTSANTLGATSTLAVNVGGTGSTTPLGGILAGNGTGAIKSALIGTGLSFDGTTLTNTVTDTTASSTLLADTNTWSGSNSFTNAPTLGSLSGVIYGNSGTLNTAATTSVSISGPFVVPSSLAAFGASGAITYTGLATTSQPSSSQLLVSNGGAGVYGVATSSATLGLGLSGSIIGLGASNSLTIATSSLYSGSANQIPYFTSANTLGATSTLAVNVGGTGSTTPLGGILAGNGTGPIKSVVVGSNLTWDGTTLSATGGGSASTTLLADTNTWSGSNTFSNTPTLGSLSGVIYGNSGALSATATTTLAVSGPFTVSGTLGNLLGGTNSTITYTGLATTSQPSSSQLLVSNGGAGVYGVATTTVSCSGSASCSQFTVLGSSPITISVTGGGGAGGTWSTTTSQTLGVLINYPNESDDVVVIGDNATTSAEYWFDPTTLIASLKGKVGIGTTAPAYTLTVGGASYLGGNLTATGTVALTNYSNGALAVDGTGSLYTFSTSSWRFASSTLLGDTNTWSGSNSFTNAPTLGSLSGVIYGNSGTLNTAATTSVSISGPFVVPSSLAAFGASGAITYTGLATTSQPSSSQLLVSNGGAGVYGVATSSATLGLGLSGSLTGLGSSNSLTIATSSLYTGTAGQVPYFSDTNILTATSTLFLASTGRVGIATTAPAATLDVWGNLLVGTSSTPLLFVDSTTKTVSIGTTTLQDDVRLRVDAITGMDGLKVSIVNSNTTGTVFTAQSNSGSVVGLIVRAHGRVGIGTTSPLGKLSIHANPTDPTLATTLFAIGSSTATATTTLFRISNIGAVTFGNYSNGALAVDGTGSLYTFSTSSWSFASSTLLGDTNTWSGSNSFTNAPTLGSLTGLIAGNSGSLYQVASSSLFGFTPAPYPFTPLTTYGAVASATTSPVWLQSGLYASSTVAFGTAAKELYFNASNGFLGLATTSPWAQLSINPTSANGSAPAFAIGSSTGTSFVVTNGGDVGIGTTNPEGRVHIFNGSAGSITADTSSDLILEDDDISELTLLTPNAFSSRVLFSSASDSFGAVISWSHNDNLMRIGTRNSGDDLALEVDDGLEVVRIDSTGKVGVASTSPYAKLSIHGNANDPSIATTLFAIGSSTASATTTLFSINNTGTLDINPSGFGTATNTPLITIGGEQVLYVDDGYTAQNLGLGYRALKTAFYDGDNTGGSNTAVGGYALYDVLNGTGNTAIGAFALASTTGSQSLAGSYNTAVGSGAGVKNITGSSNAYLGENAFFYATSSSQNVGIGASVGVSATGRRNTLVGAVSGFGNGDNQYYAQGNAFLGYATGYKSATSSDYNTFLGYQAGYLNTSGYNNIFLGAQENTTGAGYITTGGNNIGIGYNTRFPSPTASNQLNIGNFVFGTLPATTSASTFGLPTAGFLGIGTSSPYAKLSIQSNNGDTSSTLFAIGSSTASATTTLFSISNIGTIDSALGAGALVSDSSGIFSASSTLSVNVGGTGSTTSLGGILAGNGTGPIKSVVIGSNLSFDGTTLSATGGGTGFDFTAQTNYGVNTSATTTPIWAQAGVFASSSTAYPTLAVQQTGAGYAATFLGGNVGIKTASPTYTLDVAGFINTDQYSGYKQAGNTVLYASSTNFTTLVGIGAGAAIVSATANYSTALGYQALTANTTGLRNIAIGYKALTGATGATQETAIGYEALASASLSGTSNVAVGYRSLQVNTSGAYNNAFGDFSLNANTTGAGNVGVGYGASYYNGSATSTVAVGYLSAYGNGSAYANQGTAALGYQTGYNFLNGSDYNTLLGYQAGYDITSGARNIIIGQTETTGSGITTGSGNILIGSDLRTGFTGTASNQLNIGNLVFGTGLGSGTTLGTGNIGIGTTTPNWRLTIASSTGPQLALTDGSANEWTLRSAGGALYFATSTYTATSSNTSLTIDSNGNVGAGTTGPEGKLHVYAGSAGSVTANTNSKLVVEGSGTTYVSILSPDNANSGIVFGAPSDSLGASIVWQHDLSLMTIGTVNSGDSLSFETGNATEAVRILSNGNFGIGTTSPWALLSVNPTSANGSAPAFTVGSSSATSLVVTNTGYVGIGTSTSAYRLEVDDGGASSGIARFTARSNNLSSIIVHNGSGTLGSAGISLVTGSNTWSIRAQGSTVSNQRLDIYNDGLSAPAVTFEKTANNVGIGTTSPYAKLSVHGNANDASLVTTLFAIGSSTASATTTLFSISNTGAVNSSSLTSGLVGNLNGTLYSFASSTLFGFTPAPYPFTPLTTYGAVASATTSPVWLQSGLYASTTVAFGTAGKDFYYDSTTGSLGLGTTTPNARLNIVSGSAAGNRSTNILSFGTFYNGSWQTDGSHFFGKLSFNSADASGDGPGEKAAIIAHPSGSSGGGDQSAISFWTKDDNTGATSEKLRIDYNGYVGIGSTTPQAKLAIHGNANDSTIATTLFSIGSSTASATTTLFSVSNIGQVNISTGSTGVPGLSFLGDTDTGLYNPSANVAGIINGATEYTRFTASGVALRNDGIYRFYSGNLTGTSQDTGLSRLSAGVVAIGNGTQADYSGTLVAKTVGVASTSPFAKLSIHANATDTLVNNTIFAIGSSTASATTTLFRVTNTGVASTTSLIVSNLNSASCDLKADTNGVITCGTDATGSGGSTWTSGTTYGASASATTTPIWLQSGSALYASTTVAFGTAGKDLYFSSSNGFLGLATSTPWAQLSINPTSANGSAPVFAIGSSTATNFVVTNSGKVGIGTSSPSAAFAVQKYDNASDYIAEFYANNLTQGIGLTYNGIYAVGANPSVSLNIVPKGTYGVGIGVGTQTSNALSVYTSTTGEGVAIGTDNFYTAAAPTGGLIVEGKTGIGTTSPYAKLSIHSNANDSTIATTLFAIGSSTASATSTLFSVSNTGNVAIGAATTTHGLITITTPNAANGSSDGPDIFLYRNDSATSLNNVLGTIYFDSNDGTFSTADASVAIRGIAAEAHSNSAKGGHLAFETKAPGTGINGASTERFRITSTGLVGIGTTTPSAILTIASSTGPQISLADTTNSSDPWTLRSISGNFFIATASPSTYATTSSAFLSFIKGGPSALLGISSTSPWGLLSVNPNNLSGPAFVVGSSSGTNFIVSNAGNVGVSTTTPQSKFVVAGTGAPLSTGATAVTIDGAYGGGITLSDGLGLYGGIFLNGTTLAIDAKGSGAYDANTFVVDFSGNRVGVGTSSPYKLLSIGGDVVVGAATAGGTLGDLYLPNVASQSCLGTDSTGKVQAGTCTGGSGVGTVSTSTTPSIGGLAYWTTTGAWPEKLGTVATTSISAGLGLTQGGTWGALVGGSAPTLSIATSSLYTGTTAQIPYFSGTNTLIGTSTLTINAGGYAQVLDDVDFAFGTDADWKVQYDEGVDNQLLFVTANTSAVATADPMFEILVGTTPTSDQQVFGIAKGTQSSNTALFTVDAEGDGIFAGNLNASIGSFGSYVSATGLLAISGNDTSIELGGSSVPLSDSSGTLTLGDVDIIDATTETTIETAIDTLANLVNATSSGSLYVTGSFASTTKFYANGLTSCQSNNVLTWDAGVFGCEADDGGAGSAFAWTPDTTYGANANSTSTPIWLKSALYASSTVAFGTASKDLRFDSSTGYFSLGSSSPNSYFTLQGPSSYYGQLFEVATSTGASYFHITNSGGIGVGTSSPWATFSIASSTENRPSFVVQNNGTTSLAVFANGVVGIGTSSPNMATTSSVIFLVGSNRVPANSTIGELAGNGAVCYLKAGAAATCSSDARLKQNIASVTPAYQSLLNLNPVTYNWLTEATGTPAHTGFIAQQVLDIFPDLVTMEADGFYSMSYGNLTPYLVSAFKQQNNVINITNALQGTSTLKSLYQGSTTPAITVDAAGNVGIGKSAPTYALDVSGDVAALGFVNLSTRSAKTGITYLDAGEGASILDQIQHIRVATYQYKDDPTQEYRLGLIAEEAPNEVLTASGKGVDIYKLASFTLVGVQQVASKVDTLSIRMDSLEEELAKIKSEPFGAGEFASTTSLGIGGNFFTEASSTISDFKSASDEFTSSIFDGAAYGKLVIAEIVAKVGIFEKLYASAITLLPNASLTLPSGTDQVTGSGLLPAGQTSVFIPHKNVTETSKIFITMKTVHDTPLIMGGIRAGEGFVVSTANAPETPVAFDWLMITTYDAPQEQEEPQIPIPPQEEQAPPQEVTIIEVTGDTEPQDPETPPAPEPTPAPEVTIEPPAPETVTTPEETTPTEPEPAPIAEPTPEPQAPPEAPAP